MPKSGAFLECEDEAWTSGVEATGFAGRDGVVGLGWTESTPYRLRRFHPPRFLWQSCVPERDPRTRCSSSGELERLGMMFRFTTGGQGLVRKSDFILAAKLDLCGINVATENPMAVFSHARARSEAETAGAEDGDTHETS
jgi:hypothetical protein